MRLLKALAFRADGLKPMMTGFLIDFPPVPCISWGWAFEADQAKSKGYEKRASLYRLQPKAAERPVPVSWGCNSRITCIKINGLEET